MSDRVSQARAQMRARFLVRAAERLSALGNVLLALESRPGDAALAEELMREIHTLKGEAKLMQLADINAVAHETEEVILGAHGAGFGQSLWCVEHILSGFDAMRAIASDASQSGPSTSGPRYAMRSASSLAGNTSSTPRSNPTATAPGTATTARAWKPGRVQRWPGR